MTNATTLPAEAAAVVCMGQERKRECMKEQRVRSAAAVGLGGRALAPCS